MKTNKLTDTVRHETRVLQSDETIDKQFSSQHTYPDESAAQEAFNRSVEKLLRVNDWSSLSVFTADFILHDATGQPKPGKPVEIGDYLKIVLPGPLPENWVRVVDLIREPNRAEFTVRPTAKPGQADTDVVAHFFDAQASSTFRVERTGNTLTAWEIGKNEAINNQEPQAGNRAAINTLIAAGGWLFYEKIQWQHLTDFLVHQ